MVGTIFQKKFENAATIATTANWWVPVTDADKKEYTPFNEVEIFNNSAEDLEIRFEGSSTKCDYCPAGYGYRLKDSDGKLFYSINIYNRTAGTIAVGEIIVIIRRKGIPFGVKAASGGWS